MQKCGRSKMWQFRKVRNIPFWKGGGYTWAQVNQTQVSSTLDHEMPLPGGTSEFRSTGPKLVPTLYHEMPLLVGYVWAQVNWTQVSFTLDHEMPLLVGYVWAQVIWTQVSSTLDHEMPLPGGTSELRSTRPKLVPLLTMICCYQRGTSELVTSDCNCQADLT